jgi:mono/diheme cytochrome c family protein
MKTCKSGIIVAASAALVALAAPAHLRAQTAAEIAKGKELFKAGKCSVCHKVGSTGGKLGPDLSNEGNKRKADWLESYLPNPKSINPKNVMPPVKLKDADLKALIAYVLSLKTGS